VKLPAPRAGLPEEEISFILCPFLPAGRQGPRLQAGLAGHVSAAEGVPADKRLWMILNERLALDEFH
jgi:hypothetical protein